MRNDRGAGQEGFTLSELLVGLSIATLFLLGTAGALSYRPAQARAAALGLQAMLLDARILASTTEDASEGSGATVAVTTENGQTVFRLYRNRPGAAGGLVADGHIAPVVTSAQIQVSNGRAIDPPFAILISSSGYAMIAAGYDVKSTVPPTIVSCPTVGYSLRFIAGTREEDHPVTCENTSLETNAFLPH